MKHRIFLLFISMLLAALTVRAQDYSYGIDPVRDSAAFARFRLHMDSIRRQRPTVALVLSGGGAKGAAQIPVIQYLDSIRMPIDLVMGTSIGGLLGGLYAAGYTGDDLEKLMRNQQWDYLIRDVNPRRFNSLSQKDYDRQYQINTTFGAYLWDLREDSPTRNVQRRTLMSDGIVQGRNVENLFASLLVGYEDPRDFLSLPIPFACIATDMISAKPKIWHSGRLIDAMRSTMAIPGLFTPVRLHGMVLLDGGMRSNMPAEVARQMGADIIIAIDISSPALDAQQMNTLIDIVYQASDVMAREAYNAALKETDLYIHPDISGFGMLDFDRASIDSLLVRGRQAIAPHRDEIEALRQRLLPQPATVADTTYAKQPATSIMQRPIIIDTILFSGITPDEEAFIRKEINLHNVVNRYLLERAVARLVGSKAFEKVTYTLLGDKSPYTLRFDCHHAPVNHAAVGARFDSRDYAALQLHCGLNANRLTGSRLDLTARLGLNSSLTAAYTYRTTSSINPGIDLSFQMVRNGNFSVDGYNFHFDFNRTRADLHLDLSPGRRFNMRIGAQAEYYYWTTLLADYTLVGNSFQVLERSNLYPSLYMRMRLDSYDHAFFPTQGSRFRFSYHYHPEALIHSSEAFHALHLAYQTAFTSGRFTLQPFVEARYLSANVIPYTNALTINPSNAFLDQQIPFVGSNTAYACLNAVATLGANLRARIVRKHHLIASVQLLHQSETLTNFIDSENSATNIGVALEYAYQSIIGPLRANIHWSNLDKSLGAYLSLGLEF